MGTTLFEVVVSNALDADYRSLTVTFLLRWFPVSKQGLVETVFTKFTSWTQAVIFVIVLFLVETFDTIL